MFSQLFEVNTVRIFKNMIVPLLMHTAEDLEEIEEDPRESVAHIEDICDEQKSGSAKCWAARLLGDLSEIVPGFISFAVNVSLYQLVEQKVEEETLQLQGYSKIQATEVALVVLNVVSYHIKEHSKLRRAIDLTLERALPSLLYHEGQAVIIRQRAFHFCSLNLHQVFATLADGGE